MPQVVAHILVPLLIMSLVRDTLSKSQKRQFPLHYVLIAGIAGILPDLDIAAFWVLHFFGFEFNTIHKTLAHAFWIPIILFGLYFVFQKSKITLLSKHKLKLSVIFLMLSFGMFFHVLLDLIAGYIPLVPLFSGNVGFYLFYLLPVPLNTLAAPCLDAALLIIYLIYLELKHKVSDFI